MKERRLFLHRIDGVFQQYISLEFYHRGAHDFEQKSIHAAGVPIFPQQGVTQMIEALDHNTVFGRGEGYLEFLFPNSAVLLFAFIVSAQRHVVQMCECSPALRVLDAMKKKT